MEILSSRVLLRPTDPEATHRFYGETLGLAVYREYGSGDHRGVVYFLGSGYLEVSGRSRQPATRNVGMWLQVRDLAEAHRHLEAAGVTILAPPERKPWGLDEMWIADPDGVRIAVIEIPPDHPLRYRP